MRLLIFGAQGIALGVKLSLQTMFPKCEIEAFLVSKQDENPMQVAGIPVKEVKAFCVGKNSTQLDSYEVLLAIPEIIQDEIEEYLAGFGFRYIIRISSEYWAQMMERYYLRKGNFLPISALPPGVRRPFVRVYAAQSAFDRVLCKYYHIPDWVKSIQVGAALVNKKTAEVQDYTGENISLRNGNYCELTALYWIWKNRLQIIDGGTDEGQYYGLVQYRRMLMLSKNDLGKLQDNDIDVVLPYPMPYEPNISMHHKRYLKNADWKVLIQAIKEFQPGYLDILNQAMRQSYMYNYNIIIAKKRVLRDYCAWLFPILNRVEELSIPKGHERSDRYIGYMGENLETIYFLYHANDFNIVHTACKFLV